jgi:hypothetical protein
MMEKVRSLLAALLSAMGAAPNCIAAGMVALLGLAGSATAALVMGWLMPVLIGLSLLLLGRSFYILYVKRRGNRTTTVITWLSAALMIGIWTWRVVDSTMAAEQETPSGCTTVSCQEGSTGTTCCPQ